MVLTQHGINALDLGGSGGGSVTIGDKTYRTVVIGNQEWLAENLDLAWTGLDVGSSTISSETPKANYYDNDISTYGWNSRKCGLLYNWPAVHYLDDNSSTMLPPGWRVPTQNDWATLAEEVGGASTAGTKLKSADVPWTVQTGSWGGSDDYHFESLPAGYIDSSFGGIGICTYFWTSEDEPHWTAIAYWYRMDEGTDISTSSSMKDKQYSLRLCRNIQ